MGCRGGSLSASFWKITTLSMPCLYTAVAELMAAQLLELQPVDGALIKRVIDSQGRAPRPIPLGRANAVRLVRSADHARKLPHARVQVRKWICAAAIVPAIAPRAPCL